MAKQVGYKLRSGAFSRSGPISFGDSFPGRWSEDEPVALSDLGLDEKDADAIIAELELPLDKVKNATPMLPEGVMVSGADVPHRPEDEQPADEPPAPPAAAETSSAGEGE